VLRRRVVGASSCFSFSIKHLTASYSASCPRGTPPPRVPRLNFNQLPFSAPH
jgi:hypothetical protein